MEQAVAGLSSASASGTARLSDVANTLRYVVDRIRSLENTSATDKNLNDLNVKVEKLIGDFTETQAFAVLQAPIVTNLPVGPAPVWNSLGVYETIIDQDWIEVFNGGFTLDEGTYTIYISSFIRFTTASGGFFGIHKFRMQKNGNIISTDTNTVTLSSPLSWTSTNSTSLVTTVTAPEVGLNTYNFQDLLDNLGGTITGNTYTRGLSGYQTTIRIRKEA